ncbi:hemerythrin domain-containing protein [Herbidospora sp. NEAU-GS84]|uniref:Hemerythrin domain-containing protein n=1 Tax=Herbidospora solisilvae TaxID=2696284 RepID=A0A7C9J2T0_9ACTN|nr:hemerythrin domain-containing protein [Herbidospora solisilvae]NAS23062.1 hemerythrin domain-containing protein [Herbidospora solisilvae]
MSADRPDTHDMLVVHRVFRRESRMLAELVPTVAAGDVVRAGILAAHHRDYALGLHHHHTGEDELIWPKLLARVDLEADLVIRMEHQHERVQAGLDRIGAALPEWERTADPALRDHLAALYADHRAALLEHLDDEEKHVLSLIEEHLTVAEYAAAGARFATETPNDKLLLFLGALLEEATPAERAHLLGTLPLAARLAWFLVGRRRYARQVALVRGPSRG